MGDNSSSSEDEDDLPCLSPIEDSGVLGAPRTADHVGISFQQLLKDKAEEDAKKEVYQELEHFSLGDTSDEEDDPIGGSQSSQPMRAAPKEVLCYGTRYVTGYKALPELVVPEEIRELCHPDTDPDLLVILPWGDVIRDSFTSPAHYQVWLFGLVCYCQDTEVSRQATYILLRELENTPVSQTYTPPAEDLCNVFDDYGAVSEPEVLSIYDIPEVPSYYENIKNALKVYGTSVKLRDGDSNETVLESVITVVKLIARFCQDQHVTTCLEFVEISNILSNIFDGLNSFTSVEIDRISLAIAEEVRSMLVAPALCQVIRSGNPRCHLILEQVTLLILSQYAGMPTTPSQETATPEEVERPQLHNIILKIVESSLDVRKWEEVGALCTILDYHVSQAVLDKDQLAEAQSALRHLYTSINEKQEERLSTVKTRILAIEALVMKRGQMGDDAMTMFWG